MIVSMSPRSRPRPAPRPASDAELWEAAERDRVSGLAAIYDRYAGLVYGLALAILAQAQEAEDLAHEIFVTLCDASGYDPARGPLSAYLVTVTRSQAIDRLRKRSRRGRLLQQHAADLGPQGDRSSPLERMSGMECAARVQGALAQLPEMQRRVIEMAYYSGLTHTQIAAELGAPLGTVKGWTRKGLLALARLIDPVLE